PSASGTMGCAVVYDPQTARPLQAVLGRAESRALSKPLVFQGHGEVYKKSLPQMTRFSPCFLLALHRQVQKITIFTPQPPCTGDSSRCKLDPRRGSRYLDAARRYSALVCLGG